MARRGALVAGLLALLGAAPASPALARDDLNSGAPPAEEALAEVPAAELAARRQALRDYFATRRQRLKVVATTVTDSGQVLDWIPRDSQTPDGRLASPPPRENLTAEAERGDSLVPLELAQQPLARGPAGTVPVLRRDLDAVLDNLAPPSDLEDFLSKYGRAGERGGPLAGRDASSTALAGLTHEYAHTAQIAPNFGGHGNINVWNPYVYLAGEFSLGQTSAAAFNASRTAVWQTVEAGWQDFRNLYGDYYPHFFIFYTTNGYASQGDYVGGYNRDVDGWVQYSSTVFPGARLTAVSTPGGAQYSIQISVQLYNGNWWVGLNGQWVGYYPGWLFAPTGLQQKADELVWFGEVVDLGDGLTTYTDMGSGAFAAAGWQRAAYMRNLWFYNLNTGYAYQYTPGDVRASKPGCYTLDGHFLSGSTWGSYFWFGGPGNNGATCF